MGLFTNKENAPPEETVEQARARREGELLAEIRALDEQVAALRDLIAAFRVSHLAIVNDTFVFTSSDPDSLDTLRSQWSALVSEAGRLTQERDSTLAEWSELCSDRKDRVRHAT
jgi:hypothetical protein